TISKRRNRDLRPELRAVFAHSPAFLFKLPFGDGGSKGTAGLPVGDLLLWIKDREMLADNFLGLIALHLFGSGIPTDNLSHRVEHDNGVILYAFDHQSKPFVTFLAFGFQPVVFTEVHHRPDHADGLA